MTPGKENAYKVISDLVDRFEDQAESYNKTDYNETMTRRDFIDPFFKALGWDVDNSQGNAEAYREVIHEDRVRVGKETKAPDYSFRLPGGKRLFFVEAKKPSVHIKTDEYPAFQVRRYGWSAKLPISIITDFEELSVYDCTKKPLTTDKASSSRIKYLNYTDYLKEFDFIWDTFSKERVLKGGFDKYIKSDTVRKGTATVDKEFLLSLDEWRTRLAISISKNNSDIKEDELNFLVQQTIDRMVFLRICEDRGVEPYGKLRDATKHGDYYHNLLDGFREADEKYNSGLFNFRKDKLSKVITIDNKTIKSIISEMYYPVSPYEFSVLSVEILGNVYEQFLGKQITLDDKHKVRIEEKPEVRKAGGVYYTPEYIVEYIVNNTVGKLIEGKTPKEISKIKIVDPACGSGSFLLGAFQYLLNYHRDYYNRNPVPKATKEKPITPDGNLTTSEKKRILINNIFGVDIDDNAVEVTKLSLLLKCMEGETEASITNQFKLWNERVLPTLDENIRSGNSLVDVDFYDTLDFGEEKKVKPFSWKSNFPEVFKQGGFDVVIGNPPYVKAGLIGIEKKYFSSKYKVYDGTADLYTYFFEKGINLLNKSGLFGIIVANKWMRASYGKALRKWLKDQEIRDIIDFGDLQIFEGVTTYPCIIITGKGSMSDQIDVTNMKTLDFDSLHAYVRDNRISVSQSQLSESGWNLVSSLDQELFTKIIGTGTPLGKLVKTYYGIKTGLNEAFVISKEIRDRILSTDKNSGDLIKPFLGGREIKRYGALENTSYLILIPKGFTNTKFANTKNAWRLFQQEYPSLTSHLETYKEAAEKRTDKGDYWWELRACDYYTEFEKPKIIFPDIAMRMQASYDEDILYCTNTAYILPVQDKYLLGILNSNLTQFIYTKLSTSIRGGYLRFIRQYVEDLPIKVVDDTATKNKRLKNEIIRLVDLILTTKRELYISRLSNKQEELNSKANQYSGKIDNLVYELYGLTKEEIDLIETSNIRTESIKPSNP
ncbi:MAG: TaqI-like C-terminal specificity domain-containing protein [Ferruginibacter sp.]